VWHYNMGVAWYRLGDPKKTASHWRTALAQDPTHVELRPLIEKLERGEKLEERNGAPVPPKPSGLAEMRI